MNTLMFAIEKGLLKEQKKPQLGLRALFYCLRFVLKLKYFERPACDNINLSVEGVVGQLQYKSVSLIRTWFKSVSPLLSSKNQFVYHVQHFPKAETTRFCF